MKGYPISSFLFWDVAPENKPNWQIYKFAENFRFGEVHNEIAETDGRDVTLVLDGQQRLTSLMIGLRGTFTVKAKNKRWDNPSAWSRRRLYLDLLFDPSQVEIDSDQEDAPEPAYAFELFETPPAAAPGKLWLKVGDILNHSSDDAFYRFRDSIIERLPDSASRLDERTVSRNLDRLHRMIWKDEIVSYYTENDQDYDRVLGIFIRANDGGTKLSKSDLMLSMIASKWTDMSAREEIYRLVDTLNQRLDRKNDVTKDFVMKASLLLSDLDHVYQVRNFANRNLEIMRANWPRHQGDAAPDLPARQSLRYRPGEPDQPERAVAYRLLSAQDGCRSSRRHDARSTAPTPRGSGGGWSRRFCLASSAAPRTTPSGWRATRSTPRWRRRRIFRLSTSTPHSHDSANVQ